MDLKPWLTLQTRQVFSSERVSVSIQTVQLPDGRKIDDYYRVYMPDFVVVLAQTTGGRFLVERQYKHGPNKVGLFLPAGGLADAEDPLDGAKRELLEETGFGGGDWHCLGSFVLHTNQRMCYGHLFVAVGVQYVQASRSEDLEEMDIVEFEPFSLEQALANGAFPSISAAATISMGLAYLAQASRSRS